MVVFLIYLVVLTEAAGLKLFLEEKCGEKISMDKMGVNWMRLKPSKHAHYASNMDCSVTIETDTTKRLVIVFQSMRIEYEPRCDDDYLLLYDGNSTKAALIPGLKEKICGTKSPTGYYDTTTNVVTVRFRSDAWSNEDGFQLIITSYHKGKCMDTEFKCSNNKCIDSSLVCDGKNNCGDSSDECTMSRKAIWGVVGAVLILSLIGSCFTVASRRRKRRKEEKEKLRKIDSGYDISKIAYTSTMDSDRLNLQAGEQRYPHGNAYYFTQENFQIPGIKENEPCNIGQSYDSDLRCQHEFHKFYTAECSDYIDEIVKNKMANRSRSDRSKSVC